MTIEHQNAPNIPNDPRDEMVDHEEIVLRAWNQPHYDRLYSAQVARWVQEHPYDGAGDAALQWARENAQVAKEELREFEQSGPRNPDYTEQP